MWIELKVEDMGPYVYGPQRKFLESPPGDVLGGGIVEVLMRDVVAWLRAEIRSGGGPLSLRKSYIPPSLKGPACWLVLEALQARFPLIRMTPEQAAQVRAARELVGRLAKGGFKVEEPRDPMPLDEDLLEPEGPGRGFSVLRARRRDATGKHLRGF